MAIDSIDTDNPYDLLQIAARKQFESLLPQAILQTGVRVDVIRATSEGDIDSVYGMYSGQKEENLPSFHTRVLGLPIDQDRASMINHEISGFLVGSELVYALVEPMIQAGDVLVVPNTDIRFLVTDLKAVGTDQVMSVSFKVASIQ